MAFKPSLKRKVVPASEELDITPIMNLVVVLIPLLLATAEFVKLGLLETRLPPASAGSAASMPEELEAPQEKLNLVVALDEGGIGVSIFGATSESESSAEHYTYLAREEDGDYNFTALSERLLEIRRELVVPAIRGEIQNTDSRGKPIFNPDGTPQMVDDYTFSDAENVMISAPNDLSFNSLVQLLDHTRDWKDPVDKKREKLFPSPLMGKIQ